jgi:hypothetical protein
LASSGYTHHRAARYVGAFSVSPRTALCRNELSGAVASSTSTDEQPATRLPEEQSPHHQQHDGQREYDEQHARTQPQLPAW